MWKTGFFLLNLLACAACQTAALSPAKPVPAGALAAEYQQSSTNARSKYDGRELVVRGSAETAAKMPRAGDDQGSVLLKERNDTAGGVTCWFSREQMQGFSKIKDGDLITVKGVFNGEAGVELKFCKLVSGE